MPTESTIDTLARWFRGTRRESLVLVQTPDGPKRMAYIKPTYVLERDGKLVATDSQYQTRYAVVIHLED